MAAFDDFIPINDNDIGVQLDNLTLHSRKKKPKKQKLKKIYDVEYDNPTTVYYTALRKSRTDPITSDTFDVDDPKAFQFKNMWDPYTGERLAEDPNGALYFNPITLIKFFHTKRYANLWCEPTDTTAGYYHGYYGCAVGAGEDGFVQGRGHHPEWYLFRLPISNCYLSVDHNKQFITMGPKLTYDELMEINNKATKYWSREYSNLYGNKLPCLRNMYTLYMNAINENPLNDSHINLTPEKMTEFKNKINRDSVDKLVTLKG